MQNCGVRPVGIYEKGLPDELSWDERLSQAAQAGYDFVEMSIDVSEERLSRLEWSSSDRQALRRSIENSGVPVLTMGVSAHRIYPLGSPSAQVRDRGLKILCQAINLASDLEIRLVQLMGYDIFDETSTAETRARFVEGLSQGARWASAAGVMLGLENCDVATVDSAEKALGFVRQVNSPWLNVFPDVGNMTAAGYDPAEQLLLVKDYLVGLHVKDTRPGELRGVLFEQGIVPFDKVFSTIAALDYCGPLVIEMWSHLDKTGDPLRAAAQARQFVGRLLQESGDLTLVRNERN